MLHMHSSGMVPHQKQSPCSGCGLSRRVAVAMTPSVHSFGRCNTIMRRAADVQLAHGSPSDEQRGQQEQLWQNMQDDQGGAGSKCPFLAALPSPPKTTYPWYNRLQQLFQPELFQRHALGGEKMVSVPGQLGLMEQVIVGTPAGMKTVFSGEAEGITSVHNRQRMAGRGLLGTHNLLAVPEPRHGYLRRLIMPAFSPEAITLLVPRMEAVLDKYLNSWADAGHVRAHDELRHMTFEFIIAVVLGKDYPTSEVNHLSDLYGIWAKGLMAWPFINLPFTPFGRALQARKDLLSWFQAAVEAAKQQLSQGQPVPGILGSLVAAVDEHGNRLTDEELTDNLLLLLLAGHDTSSTSLTNCLALMQDHPEVVGKLRQEQQQLVAKHGRAITGAMLKDMTYADAVIRETLRLRNVVSGLFRSASKDFELEGYQIKQDTMLFLPLSHLALSDPRWVNDQPDLFRPERMLTPEGMKQGSQVPFGYGPRFCAGQQVAMAEMKVFLALLARGYDFSVDTNTEWVQQIGKQPKNGLPMTLSRRA